LSRANEIIVALLSDFRLVAVASGLGYDHDADVVYTDGVHSIYDRIHPGPRLIDFL
jgi:hypothetical protein